MESNKTPGTDGLPAELYKVFWKDNSSFLISALHYSFGSGRLSISQRRGAIKFIPKKDAELYYIKNWRPITLLNTDYKIAAKAIANRVKSVLPNLINYDQTGFMKGRFIGENLRLIDCIIQYATEKKIPWLLLFIESCILNSGWASSYFFETQRGVRQGCPLSPYLFILVAEVFVKAIRNNSNIKGIFANNQKIKISQYADDATLILDGSIESLSSASLKILDDFGKVSGLRLNDRKTEALWIGSSTDNWWPNFSNFYTWEKLKMANGKG